MKRPSLRLVALLFLLAVSQGHGYVHGSQNVKYHTMVESQVKDTEFVKFLRARGVKMETDADGLLRIYVHETPGAIPAIVNFLGLMKMWSEVTAENMVNVDTIRDSTGNGPYRRKVFSIDRDGAASVTNDEKRPPIKRYLPGHPYADAEGFVLFPNIDLMLEFIQLLIASREYCLAESLLERSLPGHYISDSTMQMLKQGVVPFREMEELRARLDRIERKLDALTPAK